jgi:hypothetical protein
LQIERLLEHRQGALQLGDLGGGGARRRFRARPALVDRADPCLIFGDARLHQHMLGVHRFGRCFFRRHERGLLAGHERQ